MNMYLINCIYQCFRQDPEYHIHYVLIGDNLFFPCNYQSYILIYLLCYQYFYRLWHSKEYYLHKLLHKLLHLPIAVWNLYVLLFLVFDKTLWKANLHRKNHHS